MLTSRSLRFHLTAGISVLTLLLLVFAGSLLWVVLDVRSQAAISAEQSLPFARHANGARQDVQQVWQRLIGVAATQGQSGLDAALAQAAADREDLHKEFRALSVLLKASGNQKDLATLNQLSTRFDQFYEAGRAMAQAYAHGGAAEGNQHLAEFNRDAASMLHVLDALMRDAAGALGSSLVQIRTSMRWTVWFLLIATVVLLIACVLTAAVLIWVVNGTIRPTVDQLTGTAEQLAGSSAQSASASQSLAAGASEQAASLEETSSTLEEIAATSQRNSELAQEANRLTSEVRQHIEHGTQSMQRMVGSINEIKGASDETVKIIRTIDEIAFQTNLLSLNAAVEAARAGDAGRGFAVVAEEVRNLALRSAQAARNTSAIIESSQSKAETGVGVAREVEGVLNDVETATQRLVELVLEVAKTSAEQTKGVEQVNAAVAQLDGVTQTNAANAEQTAASAEELSSQSAHLLHVVEQLARFAGGRQLRLHTTRDDREAGAGNGHRAAIAANERPRPQEPSLPAAPQEAPPQRAAPQREGAVRLRDLIEEDRAQEGHPQTGLESLTDADFRDL